MPDSLKKNALKNHLFPFNPPLNLIDSDTLILIRRRNVSRRNRRHTQSTRRRRKEVVGK